MDTKTLTPQTMQRGGRYNWKGQPERLEYLGKKGVWHQFSKVGGHAGAVWCEVLGTDLHMLEETAAPREPAHGCGHMRGRGAA
jgi:hypothetical protein